LLALLPGFPCKLLVTVHVHTLVVRRVAPHVLLGALEVV
jgi:hypothetical protein